MSLCFILSGLHTGTSLCTSLLMLYIECGHMMKCTWLQLGDCGVTRFFSKLTPCLLGTKASHIFLGDLQSEDGGLLCDCESVLRSVQGRCDLLPSSPIS